MSTPSFDLSTPVAGHAATNPLGLSRIDHFQLTGSIDKLDPLYRRLGFERVAVGRYAWGCVVHLRQQRMDVLIFEANATHPAGRYFEAHGEGVCALNFAVEDLEDGRGTKRP